MKAVGSISASKVVAILLFIVLRFSLVVANVASETS